VPQLLLVPLFTVVEVTCKVIVAPVSNVKAPEVAGDAPQLRVWFGAVPVTAHAIPEGMVLPPVSKTQLTPLLALLGSGSLKVVPTASPAPLLPSVTWKPMGLPALALDASAVLVIVKVGQLTVVVAWPDPPPPLLEVNVAVLE